MDVLLTDGNERAALAAARSLVRFGLKVGVAADRRFSLAGVSRGVRRLRLSTNPLADPEAYAVEIGCLARQLEVRVLLPVTDASCEAIDAGHRLLPPSVALPFPDLSTYHAASDKFEMLDRARCAGLSVPETLLLKSPDDSLPTNAGFFPAVLSRIARSFAQSSAPCSSPSGPSTRWKPAGARSAPFPGPLSPSCCSAEGAAPERVCFCCVGRDA